LTQPGPCDCFSLHHRLRTRRRYDAREAQVRLAEQFAELGLGALATARIDEHVDVGNELCPRRRIIRVDLLGEDAFDHQQPGSIRHGGAAGAQDGDGLAVLPVMDDTFHHVCVGARGHRDKCVATDGLAPVGKPNRRDLRASSIGNMREIEDRRTHGRMTFKHREKK
jgi:hypothetical protein